MTTWQCVNLHAWVWAGGGGHHDAAGGRRGVREAAPGACEWQVLHVEGAGLQEEPVACPGSRPRLGCGAPAWQCQALHCGHACAIEPLHRIVLSLPCCVHAPANKQPRALLHLSKIIGCLEDLACACVPCNPCLVKCTPRWGATPAIQVLQRMGLRQSEQRWWPGHAAASHPRAASCRCNAP